jgi:glucuronoarabinoxylan endo-1,4-beta-xylanase
MNCNFRAKVSPLAGSILVLLVFTVFSLPILAQTVYVVDQFNPSGIGTNSYANGYIGNVWGNWFGDAFQSLAWDSTSDASNNASSGSMKITASFNATDDNSQYEVFNFNGIYPPVNGLQYTNFQCDVRFAQGSATVNNTFGHLQFGVTVGSGQDYFGSVDVPSSNTNWVHVSLPLNAVSDTNLLNIYNVLIHIYGPYYNPGLSGTSTLWVDNIKFVGANPVTTNCVVNWNDVHQRIDGFGASSAWDSSWTTAQADMFFSTNTGVGLSLLRNRIAPGGTTSETSIMQMAQARGARVWSTPWSPQASFKSNGNVDGGNFLSASNKAYASQLAGYVATMKNMYGINLYAISVQNEPDVSASYESCLWTAQQIHDFATNLCSALAASNVASTKIILAEDENWQTNYYFTALNDPAVATNVGIIACHNYDGSPPSGIPAALPQFSNTNAAIWETEVSTFNAFDGSIANALYWANRIHLFMTAAQANAWHYWWLVPANPDNEGLTDTSGNPAKRMYVLGNFSRFVRPGYYRIGVSNNALTSISAYKDTNSGGFAIVAINPASTTVTQIFNLANFPAVGSVTPWITSSNLSLASQSAVSVANSAFTYALPAMSVATFVGQMQPTPPTLTPVASQTINAGVTLVITNTATDTNQPSQTLTFSLLTAPTNVTLTSLNNNTNAVFTWRPLVIQANTTNPIAIKVINNGTSLSATNSFTVTVNPLAQPTVSSINVSGRQVSLVATGAMGPDYTLWASTNLTSWKILFTSNSPAIPVTLVDTNLNANPFRFYRIQIGP